MKTIKAGERWGRYPILVNAMKYIKQLACRRVKQAEL
jgi:hypothetical protein